MSRTWMTLAGVAALAAVAVTVVLVATRGAKPRLDMPYVLLTYEVIPEDGQDLTTARDLAIDGIRTRLDERALEHAAVLRDSRSPARILVELGGKDVPFARVIELIERSAVLGIHAVDEGDLTRALWQSAMDEKPAGIYPLDDHVWSEDPAALQAWLITRPAAAQPPAQRRVVLERTSETGLGGRPKWRTYVVETEPIIDGAGVVSADMTYDANTQQPQVELALDSEATRRLADATAAAIGKKLAIVLDGRVVSAPVISGPIPGGRVVITMGHSDDPDELARQALDLQAVLRVGSMPRLALVERRDVGPSR